MFLSHQGLEIGGGYVVWARPRGSPFHKQAVGNPAEHAQDPHPVVALNPAAVVVIGNVQALMEAALDAPALAVEAQPLDGIQSFGWSTGDQRGVEDTVFRAPFVDFVRAGLGGGGLIRGEKPLRERVLSFRYWPEVWADCL